MAKDIVQTVVFKNTTPKALYDLYMNSKKHSLATAAPATMSSKAGGTFSAHNGWITGRNIHLIKDRLILQTWRAQSWAPTEPDSIFMILLEPKGKNVQMTAVHSNVPNKEEEGISKGWYKHYWEPWKLYIAGKPIAKHPTM